MGGGSPADRTGSVSGAAEEHRSCAHTCAGVAGVGGFPGASRGCALPVAPAASLRLPQPEAGMCGGARIREGPAGAQ